MTDHDPRMTRRGFLAATVAAALASACGSDDSPDAAPAPTAAPTGSAGATPIPTASPAAEPTAEPAALGLTGNPFWIGVASGDPLADSVILWTRLDPSTGLPDGDIEVRWEVATDPAMVDVVASGTAVAPAALGHSVHVDATGLEPDGVYHYRFSVDGHDSAVGRTRTFAAAGTMPERFRFGFSSCQNWEQGYYAAYRDVAETGDLDAFIFLGDYIYEYASGGYADSRGRTTGQDFECETIDQYRQRYALYRSDALLQSAHAQVPWIVTWDDHEVDNDYAGAVSENDDDPAGFLERRAAAYQAWYEFMPVRLDPPDGPDFDIYRSVAHGDLVRFHVLDTRQYRSDQQRSDPFLPALGDVVQVRDDVGGADATMLGADQFAWVADGVAASAAVWDVLAQQVLMFGGNAVAGSDPPVVIVDTWDGYAAERARLLETVAAAADNVIVLTGDFHSAAVGELRADPFDASLPVVGIEFMATSIASSFFDGDDVIAGLVDAALAANPQLRYFDSRRGYTLCEVTPTSWTATYRAVTDQFDEDSPVETISTWLVEAGTAAVSQTA
jgi:alkaline phosphatase D